MNFLNSKYYPTLMYILITGALIAIMFNILYIVTYNPDIKTRIKYNQLTGFAVNEQSTDTNQTAGNQEFYSEQVYGKFYFIILIILMAIFIFAAMLIIPRIKKYT